ncbi:MAG: N-formylglutamate amidohydrolase [Pseudoruegeria sp.]
MTHQSFEIIGEDRKSPWVITCDHATNRVPAEISGGSLGLPDADMARHIAYDVGAAGLTRALADRLNAAAVLSDFSRLVIDPNRGEDDPTLLMKLYDGSVIPANRTADIAERERRLNAYHRPYHAALERVIAGRSDCAILAVHSFTPKLAGRSPRPWHVGVLHAPAEPRLALPLIAKLQQEADLCIGDNEPYSGYLEGDSMDRHGLQHNRPHVLIELRNDLIETNGQQQAWADRLAPILQDTLEAAGLAIKENCYG